MYTDILMNGTKRFVVATSHPTQKGRFAQTGVLFELEDLKEVSEQTADQIKYICNHKVTGRVTIHQVLNPEAWSTRQTYLKVEATIQDDSDKDKVVEGNDNVYAAVVAAASAKEENEVVVAFGNLVDMQHELEEDVRFTQAAKKTLAVKDGPGEDGLWQTIRLWQSFVDQRLMARQNELQSDFQKKLQDFLKKEKGMNELPRYEKKGTIETWQSRTFFSLGNINAHHTLPTHSLWAVTSAIGFQDLSPELQNEVRELQKRMAVELEPLILEQSLTMQKILEANDHKARCRLLKYFITAELRRLESKKTLKGIFSSTAFASTSLDESKVPKEEMVSDLLSEPTSASASTFFDDEDAFQ